MLLLLLLLQLTAQRMNFLPGLRACLLAHACLLAEFAQRLCLLRLRFGLGFASRSSHNTQHAASEAQHLGEVGEAAFLA